MKILLTTLNSKFIHSSLSIRYLESYCQDCDLDILTMEFTINQKDDYITGEIYKQNPDIVAFSCYIWNLNETMNICQRLKLIKPAVKIILGGPEVSFDSEKILEKNWFIDFIVYGEGEVTFKELINALKDKNNDFSNIKGIVYRNKNIIKKNEPREPIKNLDVIPSPFKKNLSQFKNKIVYYEASRGCPFNCQFCLSSTIKGLTFFSLERVKEDLDNLINAKVKQVKFVDRTFNANKNVAMNIMKYIVKKNVKGINFHFEINAHLMDKEMLQFLKNVPEGLFQFEIGVQTTNLDVLNEIQRDTNLKKLKEIVKELHSYRNIHLHLDLIAGLPLEDYESFKKSFNDIYDLKPDKLQLGFLKLLKGSGLRINSAKYGYKYIDRPPYEVLENNYITYSEILRLKTIEDLVEKYWNNGGFSHSLNFIIENHYNSAFDFYEDFSIYWEENEFHRLSHSREALYSILYDFYSNLDKNNICIFRELMRFDYILFHKNPAIPSYLINKNIIDKKYKHALLKNTRILNCYLTDYKNSPTKKILNQIYMDSFSFDILSFIKGDYLAENMIDKEKRILLFVYNDEKVLNNVDFYDITQEFDELRSDDIGHN